MITMHGNNCTSMDWALMFLSGYIHTARYEYYFAKLDVIIFSLSAASKT